MCHFKVPSFTCNFLISLKRKKKNVHSQWWRGRAEILLPYRNIVATSDQPSWDFEGFIGAGEVRCLCFAFHLFSSKKFLRYILLCISFLTTKGLQFTNNYYVLHVLHELFSFNYKIGTIMPILPMGSGGSEILNNFCPTTTSDGIRV